MSTGFRETNRLLRREPFPDIVSRSITQTLSRTILTSGLTFLTVLVLFLMGGQVLRTFSFALVVGIVVGTYSSFGIDRKSTRLNSSHSQISYAVFCLKKKR